VIVVLFFYIYVTCNLGQMKALSLWKWFTRKIVASGALFLLCSNILAQNLTWARAMGAQGNQYARAVTIDNVGNVYTTGTFMGQVDFDPGPGVAWLYAWTNDAFVCKFNSTGNFIWAKKFDGIQYEEGTSIAVDKNGNVYTTGTFKDTCDFDPGPSTFKLYPAGNEDAFIVKLDTSGSLVWAGQLGGISQDKGLSIAIDSLGNVLTCGSFMNSGDFDPGLGSTILTSPGSDVQGYVCKFNSNGLLLWARGIGGAMYDECLSVCSDHYANVIVSGYFGGTADFDSGPGTYTLNSAGDEDAFICMFDPVGNIVWVKKMGGIKGDVAKSVTTDKFGNIFACGSFIGTADFDPGPGSFNLTSKGATDIFLAKLDSAGNFLWAKSIGGPASDIGCSVAADPVGGVYMAGLYTGTVDFDPGPAVNQLNTFVTFYGFVCKFNSSGGFGWAFQTCQSVVNTGENAIYSVAGDTHFNVYATGYIMYHCELGMGNNADTLDTAGGADIFVMKLGDLFTGIEELTAMDVEFSVYPIPTKSELIVEVKGEPINLCIVDVIGKEHFKIVDVRGTVNIDISVLTGGVYFIKFGDKSVKKILIE